MTLMYIIYNISKDDYYKLEDNTYVRKLKSYKKLKDYLIKNFSGIKDDMDYKEFKEDIIKTLEKSENIVQ